MEKQIKGFFGIRPGTIEPYTPKMYEDMPEKERPVFGLSALTVSERQDFYDNFFEIVGDSLLMTKGKQVEAFESLILPHIRYVKNWPLTKLDNTGNLSQEIYATFDRDLRNDLFLRIRNGAEVSPEESTAVKS